ncbi:helix-turn-helix transcriptional regulator [Streptomyces sp. NPDC004732]|uniref:helix-turn-helix domain-containing protein n=1 Tax=Streptomyces sp. NPDC004732 TaxID=3154290 RepID=UPI0033ABB0D1
MAVSPSSSAQAARESIAQRLKELRLDAGLNTQGHADRCGWSKSKTSRIENTLTTPSDADIRVWCAACDAPGQAQDLITSSRDAESMYVSWKRKQHTGLRRGQLASVPLYEQTSIFRMYCVKVIPGLLQTEGYARSLLSKIADFRGLPDDTAEAAKARVDRSRVIRDGLHRAVLYLEEDALYHRVGDSQVMANQLHHLLTAMSYPAVSLGIIPQGCERVMWGVETFSVFDDKRVHVELLSGKVTLTSPSDVDVYLRAFLRMREMAVVGSDARSLIQRAISSLG